MDEKLQKLFEDEAFLKKIEDCASVEEIQKLLSEEGVDLSVEDIKNIALTSEVMDKQKNGEELSEEELEIVSGGLLPFLAILGIGSVAGTGIGVGLYYAGKAIIKAIQKIEID